MSKSPQCFWGPLENFGPRAGPGRAGPKNSGPRAEAGRTKNALRDFRHFAMVITVFEVGVESRNWPDFQFCDYLERQNISSIFQIRRHWMMEQGLGSWYVNRSDIWQLDNQKKTWKNSIPRRIEHWSFSVRATRLIHSASLPVILALVW